MWKALNNNYDGGGSDVDCVGNCPRDWNSIIQTNGVYTNQNLFKKIRFIKLSSVY